MNDGFIKNMFIKDHETHTMFSYLLNHPKFEEIF